ncbi:MAG: hypothetical protein IKO19_06190 [Candidatus Riflebacteria bacterium]|nr:hypothetical protein [Candidatus Riflebacteria bacterium]
MSCINDITAKATTSVFGQTYNSDSNVQSAEDSAESFDSVMLQALKNCNGKRPEHVCCCGNPVVEEEALSEKVEELETEKDDSILAASVEQAVKADKSEATEEEKLSAGSCFTMFIKISARITTKVSDVVSGKFKDTTLAFADALKADKSYNENVLKAFMQKTDEKIASQTEDLKNYLSNYLDNMFAALQSSVSGLNSTLLSSSNLLGNSLSSYSNLLSNSSLLSSSALLGSGSSLGSNLLSGLTSAMSNYANSSSLAGYSAIDAANTQINALLSGTSNYSYGIGTSLNTNRYAGRNLSLIKSSEVGTSASGGLKMVDTKGNTTTGVAATGIEIGDSSAKSVAKVVSNSNTASGEAVAEVVNDTEIVPEVDVVKVEEPKVEIKAVSNDDVDVYVKALNRKNRIVDIFKEMILSSLNGQNDNDDIKNIDAKISISIA